MTTWIPLLCLLAWAAPAAGQHIRGSVRYLGWGDRPGMLVQLLDGSLTAVDSVVADADGGFSLDAPAGTWYLQALAGRQSSPVTDALALAAGDTIDIILAVASPLFLHASQCPAGASDGNGVLIGHVLDELTGIALPDARVDLRWVVGDTTRTAQTLADDHGRYRFCGVPTEVGLTLRAAFLERETAAADALQLAPGDIVLMDLHLRAGVDPEALPLMAVDATTVPDPGIRATVLEAGTARPLEGVRVALAGRAAVTDRNGRFALGAPPGRATIDLTKPDGARRSADLEVPGDGGLVLEIWPDAWIQQPGRTPGAVMERERTRFYANGELRALVVAGASMERYREDGATLSDILRDRFPLNLEWLPTGGIRARAPTGGGALYTIYDDTRYVRLAGMPTLAVFLAETRAEDLESVAYIPRGAFQPGDQTSRDANTAVLLIHSRGRGPFRVLDVSPAR